MNNLDDRLANAPRETSRGEHLWPGIAQRIERSRWTGSMRTAAVLASFGAGGAVGIAYERLTVREAHAPPSSSPFHAAVAVQHAGSEYLAAVGRLRALDGDNPLARDQGYESAMVVLVAAAQEVAAAADLPDAGFINEAHRAHRATISKTERTLQRGGR